MRSARGRARVYLAVSAILTLAGYLCIWHAAHVLSRDPGRFLGLACLIDVLAIVTFLLWNRNAELAQKENQS